MKQHNVAGEEIRRKAEDEQRGAEVIRHSTLAHLGYSAIGPAEVNPSSPEVAAFDQLRANTYQRMGVEINDRLATSPTPTIAERLMGTYAEGLEPQVRTATMTMRGKGYNTSASGFYGTDDNWRVLGIDNPARTYSPDNRRAQIMDFRDLISLSSEARQTLKDTGAELHEFPDSPGWVARIGFIPETPDLDAIESRWNAIADAMPDTGTIAGPRRGSLDATPFGIYCPPDIVWPMDQFNASVSQGLGDGIAGSGMPPSSAGTDA